jgi:hypothetical protein
MTELRLSDPKEFDLWTRERRTGIPTDPHYFLKKKLHVVRQHLARYQAMVEAVSPLLKEALQDWLIEIVCSTLVDTPISSVVRVGGGSEQEFIKQGWISRVEVRVVKVEGQEEALRLLMESYSGVEYIDVFVSTEKIRIKDRLNPCLPCSNGIG